MAFRDATGGWRRSPSWFFEQVAVEWAARPQGACRIQGNEGEKRLKGMSPVVVGKQRASTDGGRSQESGKKKKIRAADWITEKVL